ncbi:hypothetical protein [Halorubrum sp. ARQ200]|nr:hypothetical protein [Halorubrum sp. ARQ200]
MNLDSARVTARIVRIKDGETYHEYMLSSVPYPSVEVIEAAIGAY